MRMTVRFLALFIALHATMTLAAMDGTLYTPNKMASSLVSRTCQDSYGFVWIATDFGLSKYDGYNFINYYHNSSDTTTISSNNVRSLFCTHDGKLLVGCTMGLSSYDYHTDTFHRYTFPKGITPHIISIAELPSGDLLLATAGYGIYVLKDGIISYVPHFAKMSGSVHMNNLHVAADGASLWCQTDDHRLIRFALNGHRPTAMTTFNIGDETVVAAFNLKDSDIQFALSNSFRIYSHSRRTIMPVNYNLQKGMRIMSACMTKSGDMYFGTFSGDLYKIKKGETLPQRETLHNGHENLDYFVVNNIFEDNDKNLWLSSAHHGVYLCSMMPKQFKTINLSSLDRRICYGFSSIAPAPDNGLYCVARFYDMIHVDKYGKASFCKGIPHAPSTVMRDSQGEYWIGSWQSLYRYDPVREESYLINDLGGKGALRLAEDRGGGNMYISILGDGFAVYDRHTKKMTYYNSRSQAGATGVKFDNDYVGAMYQDKEGMMWITTSSGVWCFDPVHRHFIDLANGDGILRGTNCSSICETPSGDIVIGTQNGLYVYWCKKREVTLLPGTENIKDMRICGLVNDSIGNIWISTIRGIWQYICAEQRLISHAGARGITDNEFGEGAWAALDNGCVAFGSNSSITVFTPYNMKHGTMAERPIHLTHFATLLKKYDPFSHKFSVPWDDNHFTMSFSLFDFQNSDNIEFEYRINGGRWTAFTNGSNTLTFTKLKYGTYDIEVRAMSGGEVSSQTSTFEVTVLPPWYATTWAKLTYAILTIIVVWLVMLAVRKRQRAAFDEEKMQLLINATHDIRSPLTMILGPIEKIKETVQKTCDETTRKTIGQYVNIVNRNADRLLLLVNQILDTRRIDKNQMHLKCQETDMVEFVKHVCLSFDFTAQQRDIELSITGGEKRIMAWIDRNNFDKVIVNLLSNAFKFTLDGGHIDIGLNTEDDHIIIKVTDSGQGFGKEKTSRLFERFYQGNEQTGKNTVGTGIGLNLAMNIVRLHGGTITAANRTDGQHGACFTVSLPSGNKHLKPEFLYVDSVKEKSDKKISYKKYRIMIVDDDSELTAYIADELSPWYFVDICSNGVDALNSIISQDYDLVVSDVVMPGMDGIELLKKIKRNPNINHTPVILLSTKAEAEDRLAGFKSGADAYIAKPFSISELHVRIDAIINNILRLRGKYSGAQQQHDKVENIEVKSYDDELMTRVMKSINAHINDNDFSIEILAQEVGISRAHLHRKIKDITGVATGKFIRNIRMQQAARLILEGKVNCSDVAYHVGFCDNAYFSTVFKQYYGVSPTEYARKHKADE